MKESMKQSITDELISARQGYLEARFHFRLCNTELQKAEQKVQNAELHYITVLGAFDKEFGQDP